MRKQWKGFVSGILVSVLMMGMFGTAMATVGQHTVNVDYNDIKVTLNGTAVNLVDANGAAVEPFAINGTTYLPVRAVSSALGLEVDWDSKTNTVVLTTKEKTNPILDSQPKYNGEKHLLSPGQVFDAGGYALVDGIELLFDGEKFFVTNNTDDYAWVYWDIVGVKKDGSYDDIASGIFSGVDKERYQKDYNENGWAIEQVKTVIDPKETMDTLSSSFDISYFSSSFISEWLGTDIDIDGDGYYDVVFRVHKQKDKENLWFSSDKPDVKSEIYKIKAK